MQKEVRSKIQRGLKTFQTGKYEKSKAIYKEHATQQNPDILYIGCSRFKGESGSDFGC